MNCGTLKGFMSHKAANTPPCKWCAPYNPNLSAPKKEVVVRTKPGPKSKRPEPNRVAGKFAASSTPAVCGTNSGYKKHRINGEEACRPCKDAAAAYSREKYVPRVRKSKKGPEHGTPGGRTQHVRRGEPICDLCRIAHNEYARSQAARRKAEKK